MRWVFSQAASPSSRQSREETTMLSATRHRFLLGAAFALLIAAPGSAQNASPPDFSSNQTTWAGIGGGEWIPVPDGPRPVTQDPRYKYVPNGTGAQPTFRIGDVTNPNLKQWAKDVMKKDNDEVLAGKVAFTARSSCRLAGVPGFDVMGGGQVFFVQGPREVHILFDGDAHVRHILMNAQHATNAKPSWYGDSIGKYEGDTLVIDTVGLNAKTFVDAYRTPHTEKLHVVERWRLIEGGDKLEVHVTVTDPDTFNQPWQAVRRYQKRSGTFPENICAENNHIVFGDDYDIPESERPDF